MLPTLLGVGATSAFSQAWGIFPSCHNLSKVIEKSPSMTSPSSFSTLTCPYLVLWTGAWPAGEVIPKSFSCGYCFIPTDCVRRLGNLGGLRRSVTSEIQAAKCIFFLYSLSLGPLNQWATDPCCLWPFFHQCTYRNCWFLPSLLVSTLAELWLWPDCIPHAWIILPFSHLPFTGFAVYITSAIKRTVNQFYWF